MENELKMVKLITGDVVMGNVIETDAEITFEKPVQVVMSPVGDGAVLMPYDSIFAQKELDEITFKKEHIMYELPVAEPFEKSYIQFKTGIEVA